METISFKGGRDRNLSYIIYSKKQAIIIDPFTNMDIYLEKAIVLDFKIKGFINTHNHRDHIEGNESLEKKGIEKIDVSKKYITLENEKIKIIKTPGHSDDSKCFLTDNKLFTGDVILVNRVGMTKDDKNSKILYKTLEKIKKLSDNILIYPGHYYNSEFPSTIKKEKANNPYFKVKNFKEFKTLINKWREYMEKRRVKK